MKRFKVHNVFYELLARLGFWIPCDKFLPGKNWDWVLISHVDRWGVRGIPSIGEYSSIMGWHTDNDNEEAYIRNDCVVTHWHKLPKNLWK